MQLTVIEFTHGDPIPSGNAFAQVDAVQHIALSDNRNPGVSWSNIPEGTRSLVLICVDRDVPTKADDVNQEGREVPSDLPRCDFYHWVMVDIPPDVESIMSGTCSKGVTPHGKQNPSGPKGSRQGLNDYTQWFNGDESMQGEYFGYDGPCPPWNDSLVHHYDFCLYATDLDTLPVNDAFTGPEVIHALEGHILAEAKVTGTYTLNPDLLS
ncbi:MAG: YbhB/YbcL family Raf kinase inhibitor-like protein [Gammaproteobacteria bacterium]|nr:YbhB/YbcL family Raf kinase inhibitor-like protein [Gammaproteobacteria bacterium]NNC97879.1 YbhB/YbcL family Raf kinase inhibitor-like protein [Gammaproteobacteria bacterium]NNM13552.1 YbhB/YbcL family Raf kinase inhibitor-like protein [Gammaproteobacteria bacterium]